MAFGSKENKTPVQVPAHIGIIMDGNGRWAKKRGLPRTAGHTAGAQNFRTITRYASSIGVKYLTLYAFSTENWSRPAEEVSALMKLFHQYLEEALRDFMNENIRVRFIGDISAFAPDLQALIHRVEEASSVKTGMVLNLAMNYGGRAEITRAARILAERVKNGELSPRTSRRKRFPALCTPPASLTRISSSVQAAKSASQTSFCGRAPIPNLNILIFSGRISSRSTWTKPLKSSTADNAVSAVYDFLQCGRHMPPCTAFLLHSER